MIISTILRLKIKGLRNLDFYIENKCEILNDEILVPINLISKTSHILIDAICNYCNNEVSISYIKYNTSISKGGSFSCSRECAKEKRNKTNLNKYGGNGFGSNLLVDKIKETNLERYGVDHATKSDVVKDKRKNINIEKYGVENQFQRNDIKDQIKSKNLLKYGVEYPTQSIKIKEKIKEKNLFLYGGTGNGSVSISEKIKLTNYLKYGGHIFRNENYRKSNFRISQHPNYLNFSDKISLFKCDNGGDHNFEIKIDNFYHRDHRNITLCTICNPIGDLKSIKEKEVLSYIQSIYNGKIINGYRDELEIDIYLPELNLGFEFNGLYWHSEKFKEKDYHQIKQKYFEDKGIRIIYIWEDDWTFKSNIIKSQINNWIGITNNKIYARKCQVKLITDTKLSREFLDNNHIQGFVRSLIKIGLYYNEELVSIMIFDQFEGRKKMNEGGYNLSRFCNKLNTNVIGGASKLLSYFIKNYNPSRVISYADKSWSIGKLYKNLNFKQISISIPDYKYIIDGIRKNKSSYRRSNLLKMSDLKDMSERLIMKNIGYLRIYDCGQIKFEINI